MLAHGAIDPPAAGGLQFTLTLEASVPSRLPSPRAPLHFFPSVFRRLSIPTILPDGGSFLFNLAASAINLFTPGRFTSARLRSLTLRTPFALPSSSFSGSASIAPRKNASVTCSFLSTKTHSGPFESNAGVFHGLTYSSQSAAVFFTSARTAFITPENFPAFFTYASIHNRPSLPSMVGILPSSSPPPLQPLILVLVQSSRSVLPLLHLFHHANLLQRFQMLHHHLQRHRPILRRHRIANLLRISLPVREIQNLACILFAAAPQSFVI